MHNKEKLHKKYLIQKRFLINKVLHEIFKRNRNLIKNNLHIPKLITSAITSPNKITNKWAFRTMIKHENHTIGNKVKISENSNDFLRSLFKSLKLKFLNFMRRSM